MAPVRTIVVGGIGGNRLMATPFGLGGILDIWLDYFALVAGGWRLMLLDDRGLTPPPPLQPLQPSLLLREFYSPLVQYLADNLRYTAFQYLQDWRIRIQDSAGLLPELIRQEGAKSPVTLIGHSRGGLVIRRALEVLLPSERAALVGRVICIGTPHYGSWAVPPFLGARDPFMAAVAQILGVTDPLRPISALLPSVHQVMCSWPALYELLPAPGAPGVDPATILPLYVPARWTTISRDVKGQWLDGALARWQTLPPSPADVSWLDIYGEGVITPTALLDTTRPENPHSYEYTPGGDGVVPSAWAVQPGRARLRFGGVDHQGLVRNAACLNAIVHYADPANPLPP